MPDSIIGKVSVGDGATFTPSVSSAGELSWTNNKNLPNPATVDIAQAVIDSGAGIFLPLTGGTVTGSVEVTGGVTGNVTGNADTATNATNATNDSNGNKIDTTYMPIAGGTFTGDVNGVTPPNGDNSKKIANTEFIQALANILVPVGCVQAYAGNTLPDGWLLCDGSSVSRTDYADLYAVIGDTYGSGDGSTTFNLPNLVDKFVEGSATSGTEKSAGLPNITGDFSTRMNAGGYYAGFTAVRGAFYSDGSGGNNASSASGSDNAKRELHLDASLSSSVYGNSTTVQPPALTMRYIIKY